MSYHEERAYRNRMHQLYRELRGRLQAEHAAGRIDRDEYCRYLVSSLRARAEQEGWHPPAEIEDEVAA